MSRSSHMRFLQFFAWNIQTVVFLPIPVSFLLLFCWSFCYLRCFCPLQLVFLCLFSCLRVVVLIHPPFLQCQRILLLLFMAYSLSMQSYECKDLYSIISFHVLLSIYWIHSHVNFKKGLEYHIRTSACASSSLFLTFCPFVELIRTSISRKVSNILWGRQLVHRHHLFWPLVHLLNSFARQFQKRSRVSY